MTRSTAADVKKERRKSLYFRELSVLVSQLAEQDASLVDVYVTRVDLSADGGICYVFFSAFKDPGEAIFKKALPALKLYKMTLRQAFAQRIQARYTPDLVFMYDTKKEKQRKIDSLLDKVSEGLEPDNLEQHVGEESEE